MPYIREYMQRKMSYVSKVSEPKKHILNGKKKHEIIGELSYEKMKMKMSLGNGEKYIVPIMAEIIMPIGILWNRPKWTEIG